MNTEDELNCSDGARMLIDRMQTHPQDFKYGGRFSQIVDQILGKAAPGFSPLSDRDDTALTTAFEKYIMEPELTEYVVDEIFNGDKRREEQMQREQREITTAYGAGLGKSMRATANTLASGVVSSGYADPREVFGKSISGMVMDERSAIELRLNEYQELKQKHGTSN